MWKTHPETKLMNYDYGHLGIIGTLKQLFGRGLILKSNVPKHTLHKICVSTGFTESYSPV